MFPTVRFPGVQSKKAEWNIVYSTSTMPSYGNWNGVAYNPTAGLWAAIVNNSNVGATSTNGQTWTARTTASSSYNWQGLAHANGYFVTVGYNSNQAQTSTDGINWTLRTMPSTKNWVIFQNTHGTSGPGVLAFERNGGSAVAFSSNGTSWTESTLPAETGSFSSVQHWGAAWNGTFWMISGSNQERQVWVSTNGTTWAARTIDKYTDLQREDDKRGAFQRGPIVLGSYFYLNIQAEHYAWVRTTDGTTWEYVATNKASFPVPNRDRRTGPLGLGGTYYSIYAGNGSTAIFSNAQYNPRSYTYITNDFSFARRRAMGFNALTTRGEQSGGFGYTEPYCWGVNNSGGAVGVHPGSNPTSVVWYGTVTSATARVV